MGKSLRVRQIWGVTRGERGPLRWEKTGSGEDKPPPPEYGHLLAISEQLTYHTYK